MIIDYLIALSVFFLIDMLWLGLLAKNLYKKELGYLMKKKPEWIPAIIFYLLFILGLVVFVIIPATDYLSALLMGALFGLISYATYDLTNLATLKNWPLKITIIDLIWGAFLSSSVSVITFLIIR